jgi:putative superfamily III holin-X
LSTQLDDPPEASIGDLFHQLVEDGTSVARAEINLYREIARYRVKRASIGLVALAAGGVLALAALIVLLVMLAIGLAVQIGPVAAGLVVAVVTGILAFLLIRFGAARASALGGDEEERKALRNGERKA